MESHLTFITYICFVLHGVASLYDTSSLPPSVTGTLLVCVALIAVAKSHAPHSNFEQFWLLLQRVHYVSLYFLVVSAARTLFVEENFEYTLSHAALVAASASALVTLDQARHTKSVAPRTTHVLIGSTYVTLGVMLAAAAANKLTAFPASAAAAALAHSWYRAAAVASS